MRFILLVPSLALLLSSGCSWFGTDEYVHESLSVAQVSLSSEPIEQGAIESIGAEALIQRLEQLDPTYETEKRLIELKLEQFENQLIEGAENAPMPKEALYTLMAKAQSERHKSELAYQIARLEDISQDARALAALDRAIDEGASIEARFRRAERLFIQKQYEQAATDYFLVSQHSGKLQLHALYMLSWSQFKQARLDDALQSAMDGFSFIYGSPEPGNEDLHSDLMRLTVIALDDAGGAAQLARLMREQQKPEWQTQIYRALGDWYLSKERYADSAGTWATYLNENPMHPDAPMIALENMKTQKAAGFNQQILNQEAAFIARYDRRSDFFALHGNAVFETYREPLKQMLDRLTKRVHGVMQDSKIPEYPVVINAYEAWLANFASHSDAPRQRFLLAEVLQAFGDARGAIEQYEQVIASDWPGDEVREAAYAVLLIHQNQTHDIDAAIAASQRFADQYPTDARAGVTKLFAAKQLFDLSDYTNAYVTAEGAREMNLSASDRINAELIMGHSAFQLQRYASAEHWYRLLVSQQGSDGSLKENLLVSVFKQGESAAEQRDYELATRLYRSLLEIDAQAVLSKNAQYDIAGFFEQLNNGAGAIRQLLDYRKRYGDRQTAISARLVSLYESEGELTHAAAELLAGASEPEAKRLATYRAGELYLEAGQHDLAIQHFRIYAHEYPDPVGIRMEAMHHMDKLYQTTGQPSKRAYWLRKKQDTVLAVPAEKRTEREVHLAADASFYLAEVSFKQYQQQKLGLPLAKSLKKKRSLLNKSLNAFNTVNAFGSFEHTAKANFRIASLYELLAEDLLASERPAGLNALESSQYEMLLEEQAYPFEEQAIQLHEENLRLGWQVGWTTAIDKSLKRLQHLSPARFVRREAEVVYASAD